VDVKPLSNYKCQNNLDTRFSGMARANNNFRGIMYDKLYMAINLGPVKSEIWLMQVQLWVTQF